MASNRPVDGIQIVHMLFNDVITTEPGEVQPVSQLPLHVCPFGLAIPFPESAHVPVAAGGDRLADLAASYPFHDVQIALFVPSLRPGNDGEEFLIGSSGGLHDKPDPGRVHPPRVSP